MFDFASETKHLESACRKGFKKAGIRSVMERRSRLDVRHRIKSNSLNC